MFEEKIPLPINLGDLPQGYNLRGRLLSKFEGIRRVTGTVVTLQGLGSGTKDPCTGKEAPERLNIKINHKQMKPLRHACALVFDLCERLKADINARQCVLSFGKTKNESDILGTKTNINIKAGTTTDIKTEPTTNIKTESTASPGIVGTQKRANSGVDGTESATNTGFGRTQERANSGYEGTKSKPNISFVETQKSVNNCSGLGRNETIANSRLVGTQIRTNSGFGGTESMADTGFVGIDSRAKSSFEEVESTIHEADIGSWPHMRRKRYNKILNRIERKKHEGIRLTKNELRVSKGFAPKYNNIMSKKERLRNVNFKNLINSLSLQSSLVSKASGLSQQSHPQPKIAPSVLSKEKVIVGLDAAPPSFDVRNRVLGPGGANLKFISNETGAVVTLRGRTSGYPEAGTGQESPEPLHICVEHQKTEVLQAARQMACNIVKAIQQQFAQLYPLPPQGGAQTVTLPPEQRPPGVMPVLAQQPPPAWELVQVPRPSKSVPPTKFLQKPLPVEPTRTRWDQGPLVLQHQEKVIVGLDAAPPTFDVRNKVLGPGGANLQYISKGTGAVVTLRGRSSGYLESGTCQESPEPLHICVEHQNIGVLQAARQLACNLVETIQQQFAQLHPLPPQGGAQTVTLLPDQLPPGVMLVLAQQPPTVGGLVQVPPPSMSVLPPSLSMPPPQLLQQPPPVAALPPPGVHIPSHQGPLVPQQQSVPRDSAEKLIPAATSTSPVASRGQEHTIVQSKEKGTSKEEVEFLTLVLTKLVETKKTRSSPCSPEQLEQISQIIDQVTKVLQSDSLSSEQRINMSKLMKELLQRLESQLETTEHGKIDEDEISIINPPKLLTVRKPVLNKKAKDEMTKLTELLHQLQEAVKTESSSTDTCDPDHLASVMNQLQDILQADYLSKDSQTIEMLTQVLNTLQQLLQQLLLTNSMSGNAQVMDEISYVISQLKKVLQIYKNAVQVQSVKQNVGETRQLLQNNSIATALKDVNLLQEQLLTSHNLDDEQIIEAVQQEMHSDYLNSKLHISQVKDNLVESDGVFMQSSSTNVTPTIPSPLSTSLRSSKTEMDKLHEIFKSCQEALQKQNSLSETELELFSQAMGQAQEALTTQTDLSDAEVQQIAFTLLNLQNVLLSDVTEVTSPANEVSDSSLLQLDIPVSLPNFSSADIKNLINIVQQLQCALKNQPNTGSQDIQHLTKNMTALQQLYITLIRVLKGDLGQLHMSIQEFLNVLQLSVCSHTPEGQQLKTVVWNLNVVLKNLIGSINFRLPES